MKVSQVTPISKKWDVTEPLHINDLPNCSKKLSFQIFADDTNMFYSSDKVYLETAMNEEWKLVFEILHHK